MTRKSRYKSRPRDTAFMIWVKTQPCCASDLSACAGVVEADHAGRRGIGQKASDDTCIPLCALHHRQRGDFAGPFRAWNQEMMRSWLLEMISVTRSSYADVFVSDRFPDLY